MLRSSSVLHFVACQRVNRDAYHTPVRSQPAVGRDTATQLLTALPVCCIAVCLAPTHRQCYPLLGKNDTADPGSEGDAATQQVVVPVSNGTAALGNGQKTEAINDTGATPEVRSCPPGAIAVGSRCFKSSAGSRKGVAGTLAASAALLAAWQLAVVLVTSLLAY